MKRLFIIFTILLFTAGFALAESNVTLQWSANTETDLVGYRLYRGDIAGGPYTQIRSDIVADETGVVPTEIIDENIPDGAYFWVLTAFDTEDNESDYSNEVTVILDSVAPAPPRELNIFKKIIAHIERYYFGYDVLISKVESN